MRISDWSSDVCSSDLNRRFWKLCIIDFDKTYAVAITLIFLSLKLLQLDIHTNIFERKENLLTGFFSQIGRASCRERVCQYVSISVVAVSLKKKYIINNIN